MAIAIAVVVAALVIGAAILLQPFVALEAAKQTQEEIIRAAMRAARKAKEEKENNPFDLPPHRR